MGRFKEGETVYVLPDKEASCSVYGPLFVLGYDEVEKMCHVESMLGTARMINESMLTRIPNDYVSDDGLLRDGDSVSAYVDDEIHYGRLVARQGDFWTMVAIDGNGAERGYVISDSCIVRPQAMTTWRAKVGEDW